MDLSLAVFGLFVAIFGLEVDFGSVWSIAVFGRCFPEFAVFPTLFDSPFISRSIFSLLKLLSSTRGDEEASLAIGTDLDTDLLLSSDTFPVLESDDRALHLKLLTTLYSGDGSGEDSPGCKLPSPCWGVTLVWLFLHSSFACLRFLLSHKPTLSMDSKALSAWIRASSCRAALFARFSCLSSFFCLRATMAFLWSQVFRTGLSVSFSWCSDLKLFLVPSGFFILLSFFLVSSSCFIVSLFAFLETDLICFFFFLATRGFFFPSPSSSLIHSVSSGSGKRGNDDNLVWQLLFLEVFLNNTGYVPTGAALSLTFFTFSVWELPSLFVDVSVVFFFPSTSKSLAEESSRICFKNWNFSFLLDFGIIASLVHMRIRRRIKYQYKQISFNFKPASLQSWSLHLFSEGWSLK